MKKFDYDQMYRDMANLGKKRIESFVQKPIYPEYYCSYNMSNSSQKSQIYDKTACDYTERCSVGSNGWRF